MQRDKKGQWIITDPLDFVGWEIHSVTPDVTDPEYGFIVLVNRGNRQTRKVRSHYSYVPIHTLQKNDEE